MACSADCYHARVTLCWNGPNGEPREFLLFMGQLRHAERAMLTPREAVGPDWEGVDAGTVLRLDLACPPLLTVLRTAPARVVWARACRGTHDESFIH
jgi:hypothetical protein